MHFFSSYKVLRYYYLLYLHFCKVSLINTLLTSFLDLLGLLQVGCSSTCRYRCHPLCPLETSWDFQFKLAVCLFKISKRCHFFPRHANTKKKRVGFSRNSPDFSFAALCQTASETPSLLVSSWARTIQKSKKTEKQK